MNPQNFVNRNDGAPVRAGIQAIEVAAPLLRVLAQAQQPMALAALASAAGMARSKAHKYLASLIRIGLASQEAVGGRYKLGPFALELGLAAMRELDELEHAQATINGLRHDLDLTASAAVWTNRGPAIVRCAQTPYLPDSMRLGTVFPLLSSSFGRVFAAFLDREYTQALIEAELMDRNGPAAVAGLRTWDDVDVLLDKVRTDGISIMQSVVAPGIDAISAPVFDQRNGIVAAIAVVGVRGRFDAAENGAAAKAVAAAAGQLSKRLGAHGTPGSAAD
jgi:DNA-binding IclR family transcriptional regulator